MDSDYGDCSHNKKSTYLLVYRSYHILEACKEVVWLYSLACDIGILQLVLILFCDNQSAIVLDKNRVYHVKTNHIAIPFHPRMHSFGRISLEKVVSRQNVADALTKAHLMGITKLVLQATQIFHCVYV